MREICTRVERLADPSPYRSYAFCRARMETEGARLNFKSFIAVAGEGGGEVVALLPPAFRRRAGLRVATWIGGRMATYQMGRLQARRSWTRLSAHLLQAARRTGSTGSNASSAL